MTNELLFDQKIALRGDERKLCLKCARGAMDRLRGNRQRDGIFSPLRMYDLMWCLSSYVLFLREVAAGRTIRYRRLLEIAVAGASIQGDGEVLAILERNGVDMSSVEWSRCRLTPLALAVLNGADDLARRFLEKCPAMLSAGTIESNLKECVRFGSTAIVSEILSRVQTMCTADDARWASLLSMALFSAVARDRRETIELVLELGADGALSATDGCFPAHMESSLFSCAVDNKNFGFADMCLKRGWLPETDGIRDLPNTANALEDLEKFKYLDRAFPDEQFKKDVLDYWHKHYQVSRLVYEYCGGTGDPHQEEGERDLEDYSDAEILASFELLARAIIDNPDRLFEFWEQDAGRIRELFTTQGALGLEVVSPYVFRKAKALGLDLFGGQEAEKRFVEGLEAWKADWYVPYLEMLGWQDYRLPREDENRTKAPSSREKRYEEAASARGRNLKRFLDDPTFELDADPYVNWSFAQEVVVRGTPGTFRQWALRGMDTYGQNEEGNYAIDLAPMPKWHSLVTVFGMNPLHVAYDGSSALGRAIAQRDNETAQWLWSHGDHTEWRWASPLRMAILSLNDELARWFLGQGLKNVDADGREYPLPPWLLNGYEKKTENIPRRELARARRLKRKYGL